MNIPWGNIAFGLFVLYVLNSLNVFYSLYYPKLCDEDSDACFSSIFDEHGEYDYYLIVSESANQLKREDTVFVKKRVTLITGFEETLEIDLNSKFMKNNTIHGHIILVKTGVDPLTRSNKLAAHYSKPMTSYKIPSASKVNLMESVTFTDNKTTIAHWKPKIISHIMDTNVKFDNKDVPHEFRRMMDRKDLKYGPILYLDQLSLTTRHDVPIISSKVNVTISFSTVTIGKLRIWMQFEEVLRNLKDLGFKEDDVDEIKSIFTDTNMYFLTLTFFVSIFHLLFDFLAFKNDVSFWKNRKNIAGLSTRVIIWRAVSQIIIFLYLCEHKTSYIILGPAGVGMIIELWKVSKSLKISFSGWKLSFGEKSAAEVATEKIDSEAMWYLQWLMYPLVVGGAVYSLLYQSHRSWYSWVINSLVNLVYCFGFLMMTPQLFLNYRLKSVAHLPWRAFMYKAFNTFIDDIFAFVISMPMAHRLACFRDDVIFVIYLYQRWLYPVDKGRINEYGQVFEAGDGDGQETECDTQIKKEQ